MAPDSARGLKPRPSASSSVSRAPPDLVVIQPVKDFTCAECGDSSGDLLTMDDAGPLCMSCADMDHLVFLPAGDAALTRRAKKATGFPPSSCGGAGPANGMSGRVPPAEEPALDQAEQECLADSDARSRRRERDGARRADEDVEFQRQFAAEITRRIRAAHGARGRTSPGTRGCAAAVASAVLADGLVFDERAIALAVVASIRHEDTDYDELLNVRYGPRRRQDADLSPPSTASCCAPTAHAHEEPAMNPTWWPGTRLPSTSGCSRPPVAPSNAPAAA